MQTIKGHFTDVDIYNETVKNWDLNFKLLSKQDFSADLHIIYDDEFSLAREKLTGKIEQKGKTLEGLIVFAIPVKNCSFYWFDKKVGSDTLVLFPKENNFEVISDSNFEVYVLSIHKTIFFETMKKMSIVKNEHIFNGNHQELFLSKQFSNRFINLLNYFLKTNLSNPKKSKALINSIVFSLLKYIEGTDLKKNKNKKNSKNSAVKEAVEIINNQVNELFTVKQLSAMVGVSERTLLYAFKEKYKVSPSSYIKSVRLNMVKRELFSSKDGSIADIAGKHNFWHMGQFAKDFKNQFGVLPSEVMIKNE